MEPKNWMWVAQLGQMYAFRLTGITGLNQNGLPVSVDPAKAETKEAPGEKAAEKAKATKLAGDVGLLDTEKNYMILVTKEGKLVTLDFDSKYEPTQKEPVPAKVTDIGLGSSAVVQYTKEGDKSIATNIEFVPAKGE